MKLTTRSVFPDSGTGPRLARLSLQFAFGIVRQPVGPTDGLLLGQDWTLWAQAFSATGSTDLAS